MGKNNQTALTTNRMTHFKMYKKGRYWLFAGALLMCAWRGDVLAQADETNPVTMGDTSQITSVKQSASATLKVQTPSRDDSKNVSDSSNGDASSNKEGQSDNVDPNSESDQSSVSSKQVDYEKTTTSKDDIQDPKVTVENQPAPDESVNSDDESPTSKPMPENQADIKQVNPNTPTNSENGAQSSSSLDKQPAEINSAERVQLEQVNLQQESVVNDDQSESDLGSNQRLTRDSVTVNKLANNQTNLSENMLISRSKKQLLKADTPTDVIATGNVWGGTSQWTLDGDGVLHIGAGTFGSNPAQVPLEDWKQYNSEIKSIVFEGEVIAGKKSNDLFSNLPKLETIVNANYLNTSQVTDMSYMFINDAKLKELDLNSWDVSKVTNMDDMFNIDWALTSLEISEWNTSSLVSATAMFRQTMSLKNLDVSNWNVSNLQNASWMFDEMRNLLTLDVSKWNTKNLTNTQCMLWYTNQLTQLDLSNWEVSHVTNMTNMFAGATGIQALNLNNWQFNSAINDFSQLAMATMPKLKELYVNNWNVSNLANVLTIFKDRPDLEIISADNWDLSNVTDMSNVFTGLDNLTTLSAQNWNLPQVTDLSQLFSENQKLTTVNVSGWKIGNAVNLNGMFSNLANLTDVDVTKWQMNQVTDMSTMFANDSALSTLDLSSFDMSTVRDLTDMLAGTTQLSKLVLGSRSYLTANGTKANLPDIIANKDVYGGNTGYWVNSNFKPFTSVQLMALDGPAVLADTFVWQKNKSSLNVKDSTVNQTGTNQWQLADNLTDSTDVNGNSLLPNEVTLVDKGVDTSVPDEYHITYAYTDAVGRKLTADAVITVIASKVEIDAHDMTIIENQPWVAADSFTGARDFNGQPVTFANITVSGDDKVDTKKPGTYWVTYTNTDVNGNQAQKKISVTVQRSQVKVAAIDTTRVQGQDWQAKDSFVNAQTYDGTPVDYNQVTVIGENQVDTKKPGTYMVTYEYTDPYGNTATQRIAVEVLMSKVAVIAKDLTVMQGQSWQAKDSFVSAQTYDGTPVDYDQLTITGADQVDVKRPGMYSVTYALKDPFGNISEKAIVITVKASQINLEVKNMTVQQGNAWDAADSFVSAKDANGQAVSFNAITVMGAEKVDLLQPGTYPVVYRYTDAFGNQITKKAMITVVENQEDGGTTVEPDDNQADSDGGSTIIKPDDTQNISDSNDTSPEPGLNQDKGTETISQNGHNSATTGMNQHFTKSGNSGESTVITHSGTTSGHIKVGQAQLMRLPDRATRESSSTKTSNEADKLPQTNEQQSRFVTFMSTILFGMLGILGLFSRKRYSKK